MTARRPLHWSRTDPERRTLAIEEARGSKRHVLGIFERGSNKDAFSRYDPTQ
jgi:hypothetical protein